MWPDGGPTWEETMLRMVTGLVDRRRRTPRRSQKPLWVMVQDLTHHGATYSTLICVACGRDPETGEVREGGGE